MNYYRKEGEGDLDYIIRLTQGKVDGTYDVDYVEMFKLAFGVDYASDNCRKMFYCLKILLPYLQDNKTVNITDNDVLKQLEQLKLDIQKEKYKVQTEKIELNRWVREQSRMELFEEKILDAIKSRDKQIEVPKILMDNKSYDNEMILSIADQHYGAEFEVKGMFDETINEYNPEIFERRMWNVLGKTVRYAEKNGFKKVHILDLDDSIDGLLHISQLSTLRYGVVDSVIGYADFMETWINELSKYLFVDMSRVKGNHNDLRLLTGKKGDTPNENSSKIITHFIGKGLKNNKNVLIQGYNSVGCVYRNIAGFDVLATHGQDERGNLEQAFKNYMLAYKINIDYLYTGHLHSTMIKEIGVNKEFIQTPSIMGVNDFSLGIKKTANAGAKITVLSKGEGRTDEHNIILK
jgi:hypothetical protein